MGMSTRVHIQSLSSNGPVLVKIFEVVERWVPVEVWVHDSIDLQTAVTVVVMVVPMDGTQNYVLRVNDLCHPAQVHTVKCHTTRPSPKHTHAIIKIERYARATSRSSRGVTQPTRAAALSRGMP